MARWEHPLQLFALEHPDDWEPQYQAETGGVLFTLGGGAEMSALSLNPVALTRAQFVPRDHLLLAADRVGVTLDPDTIRAEAGDTPICAYGEGVRKEPFETPFRFWVIRHDGLALFATHLGPGAGLKAPRRSVDESLEGIDFPEILPPTPEEFRDRVLEILAREYPQVIGTPSGEWGVDLRSVEGAVLSSLGLENLYRVCLLSSEVTGALIREHLDQVLTLPEGGAPQSQPLDDVAERLLPMLKSDQWVQEVGQQLELARVDFAPGLVLCFAVDEPKRLAYVTQEMLAEWDMPMERLQQIAQDNLARKSIDLPLTVLDGEDDRPLAVIINTQDGYDAARLAIPSIRENLAEQLGDEYLVGLPNRDFLIAFTNRDPEMQTRIIRQVRHDYQRMHHPLSETIYRVRFDSVEPTEL